MFVLLDRCHCNVLLVLCFVYVLSCCCLMCCLLFVCVSLFVCSPPTVNVLSFDVRMRSYLHSVFCSLVVSGCFVCVYFVCVVYVCVCVCIVACV